MTIIITSGILMIGLELSTFIITSIRLARTSDRALVARYAAESAVESAMHQLRKEERETLRKDQGQVGTAQWTYIKDPQDPKDPIKFSPTIPAFEKTFAPKESVLQFSLYTTTDEGTAAILGISTLKISWQGIESGCAAVGGSPPGIETSIVQWNGGAVDWSSAEVHKKFQQADSILVKEATVTFEELKQGLSTKPMVVRIKPYFCDLSGLKISLPDPLDPTKTIAIPNYFFLKPRGTNGNIQDELQSIVPGKGTLSDIFDFTLFSEAPITKQE